MCLISWRFPSKAWTRRLAPSRRLEAALTLAERVLRFASHSRALAKQRGISHGRWQSFGRHVRIRGVEGDRTGRGRFLGRVVRALSHRSEERRVGRGGRDGEAQ